MGNLRYAMVCSSNMNRSMEAHKLLAQEGLQVFEKVSWLQSCRTGVCGPRRTKGGGAFP